MIHELIDTRLRNGMRVIMVPIPHSRLVSLQIGVGTGSRHDSDDEQGLAHLFEHVTYLGTSTLPRQFDVDFAFDDTGSNTNGGTSYECTTFSATFPAAHLGTIINLQHDILTHPLLRRHDIDIERGPIIEEARSHIDDPEERAYYLFQRAMYGDSPLGRTIVGTEESLPLLTREQLVSFYRRNYVTDNMVLTAVGDVDVRATIAMLERGFGRKRPRPHNGAFAPPREPSGLVATHDFRPDAEQVRLRLGFPAYPYGHPDEATLDLLTHLLGGMCSARLYVKLRGRNGLSYEVEADSECYRDVGNCYVSAGLGAENLLTGMHIIIGELAKLKRSLVPPAELQHAKNALVNGMLLDAEDVATVADEYLTQALTTGYLVTPEQKAAKHQAVTAKRILEMARRLFRTDRFRLATVGPIDDLSPLLDIVQKRLGE